MSQAATAGEGRIARRFGELRQAGRAGLIAYLTAGDPDPETSAKLIAGLPGAGADLIEIGMPFSDPMADGPAIQAAGLRALKAGMNLAGTLALVRGFRAADAVTPIILMGYYNPIYRYGAARFAADASEAGVDGVIIVDLPPEEDGELAEPAAAAGLDIVRLTAPTSDDRRLETVLKRAGGFVYYVSIAGVTGTKSASIGSVAESLARLRRHTSLPLAVGFGIRTPAQAAEIARIADAAVVGSALVQRIADNLDTAGRAKPGLVPSVLGEVAALAAGIRRRAMSWLTNVVLPKIRAVVAKREIPDNLWDKCPRCEQMLFRRELEANLFVCRNCHYHMRVAPPQRLAMLFDDSSYTRIELPKPLVDPLKFRDRKRYADRLKEAQAHAGTQPGAAGDALVVAHGRIGGLAAVAAVFDFAFMGGSMGLAVGDGLIAAARLAVLQEAALIVVPASGGARMQEGILSLMQMPRTILAVREVKEAGLPYIVILTDPTTGGVSASFAMLGDVTLAEPDAIIGFAGARVIEETIREKLPEGFQRAEYLLDHGMVDMVVPRPQLRETLARLLSLLRQKTPPAEIVSLGDREPGVSKTPAAS